MSGWWGVAVWISLSLMDPVTAAAEAFVAAAPMGDRIEITTEGQRLIVVEKEPEQVGYDKVAIAPDGKAVGWLALYPNCCTSYPIPLKLLVYAGGRVHAFTGSELPIWYWRFQEGSRQVAYEQETVHGGFGVHYELRDVLSGRVLAQHDPQEGVPRPAWVRELDVSRK